MSRPREIDVGHPQAGVIEQLDDLVAVELPPFDEHTGDVVDRLPVVRDQDMGAHVRLAEQLGRHDALVWSARTPAIGSCWNGPPVPERRMICVPICWKRLIDLLAGLVPVASRSGSSRSTRSGAIAQEPTIHAARAVALWTSPPTPVEFSP